MESLPTEPKAEQNHQPFKIKLKKILKDRVGWGVGGWIGVISVCLYVFMYMCVL